MSYVQLLNEGGIDMDEENRLQLTDVMNFFNMKPGEFAKDWKTLDDEEKLFFKTAVAEELGKEL